MPRVQPRRRMRWRPVLPVFAAAIASTACSEEFTTEAPQAVALSKATVWRDTLTLGDVANFEIRVSHPSQGDVVPPRATWRSSDDRVVRVDFLAVTGNPDSAATDSLAARRTRVQITAMGAGTATLTVEVAGSAGTAPVERSFPIVVVPLMLTRTRGQDTVAVTQTDTVTVQFGSAVGGAFDRFRLTWRSSDEARLRIETLAFTGNAATDSAISRGLRVRTVALARGSVDVVASVEGGVGLEVPELRFPVVVLPLQIVRVAWKDTLAVSDTTTLSVEVRDTRNRPVPTASVVWTMSDAQSLTVGPTSVQSTRTLAKVTALQRDSVTITVSVPGVALAEAAATPLPVRVMERWVDLISGESWTCALSFDGRPYCWGGEINGSDALTFKTIPTRMASVYQDLAVRFRRLRGGRRHGCGESAHTPGLWQCWGYNNSGQLGDGSRQSQYFAVPMFPGSLSATDVSADFARSCALTTDISQFHIVGRALEIIQCWGTLSTTGVPNPPSTIRVYNCPLALWLGCPGDNSELVGASEIDVAEDHACVTAAQSSNTSFGLASAACWGTNDFGQLGNPLATPPAAVEVHGSQDVRLRDIAVTERLSCARAPDASAYCWGSGYGSVAVPATPGYSWASLVGVKFVTEMCGVTTAGNAYCWTTNPVVAPVAQAPGLKVSKFAPSWTHRCVIRDPDGAILCWGNNQKGQLGRGTTGITGVTPVRIQEPAGRQ